jgi:hypothetical protein
MAVKLISIPITVKHPQYMILVNDQEGMKKNVENLGLRQAKATLDLDTALNDGFKRIDSSIYDEASGTYMVLVLYKSDASKFDQSTDDHITRMYTQDSVTKFLVDREV